MYLITLELEFECNIFGKSGNRLKSPTIRNYRAIAPAPRYMNNPGLTGCENGKDSVRAPCIESRTGIDVVLSVEHVH